MNEKEKWQAVITNDPDYDGIFFYGVKSTGIYCRPSCRSKAPSVKNVVFFESREAAEAAGFRPCKRCRPDLPVYDPAAETAKAVRDLIDGNFADREVLQTKLGAVGVSRRHLTKLFEKQYDMSPEQYMTRVRLQQAKGLLAEGRKITDVAFAVGMDSAAAFTVFFKKHTGVPPSEYAAGCERVRACRLFDTPVGTVRITESEKGITGLCFAAPNDRLEDCGKEGIYLEAAGKQLEEYFLKKRKAFDVPLDLHGSSFQHRVWEALLQIPYGETRSYQAVAACLGNPGTARAVGRANNRNPVLIMVPCHRIVGKDGQLTGYAGGLERKQYLLELEAENEE